MATTYKPSEGSASAPASPAATATAAAAAAGRAASSPRAEDAAEAALRAKQRAELPVFVMMARISRCTPQMAKGIAARLRAKGYVDDAGVRDLIEAAAAGAPPAALPGEGAAVSP